MCVLWGASPRWCHVDGPKHRKYVLDKKRGEVVVHGTVLNPERADCLIDSGFTVMIHPQLPCILRSSKPPCPSFLVLERDQLALRVAQTLPFPAVCSLARRVIGLSFLSA